MEQCKETEMKYGYARVSTTDQDLTIQIEALEKAGCTIIRQEKVSASSMRGRDELATLLEFLREGDTLVVTRICRLGRSLKDLQDIVHLLQEKGVNLQAIEQPVDTSTSAGKAFLSMLGVFAQFENDLRRERIAEGIAKAKQRGVYKGRKASVDIGAIKVLANKGLGASAIARELNIGRSSVYRALG